MRTITRHKVALFGLWLALPIMLAVLAAALLWDQPWRADIQAVRTRMAGDPAIEGIRLTTFPLVPEDGLAPQRVRIVEVLQTQFDAHHPGAFYSQGVHEPWCADFASWVLDAAGVALTNPNSGSWRIPGVATLQEAFTSAGRFRPAGTGYLPQPGDAVLYGEPSPFGQHVNFALGLDDGALTTVGGNELGGISVHRFPLADDAGVLGYGVPAA